MSAEDDDEGSTPAGLITELAAHAPQSDAEWAAWLHSAVKACPAYASHASILDECCAIAARWRERFWPKRAVWSRIRRGERLVKELCESAPVLARARAAVEDLENPGGKKMIILDLCSGFGYLAMFLSELLAPWADRVEKIVLVDVKWAPHNVPPSTKHLDPEHIYEAGWPIRLTTCRSNLKNACARRQLAREFLSCGAPVLLLGVHLCGTLSLRAIEVFNDARCIVGFALKPCCLPPKLHAKRDEMFDVGGHTFKACEVCADGRWRQGRWVGRSNKQECEKKFGRWSQHLYEGVKAGGNANGGKKTLEHHRVQAGWWQNQFVFAARPFAAEPPRGLLAESAEERQATREDAEKRAEEAARRDAEANAERARRRAKQAGARKQFGLRQLVASRFALMASVTAAGVLVVGVMAMLHRRHAARAI